MRTKPDRLRMSVGLVLTALAASAPTGCGDDTNGGVVPPSAEARDLNAADARDVKTDIPKGVAVVQSAKSRSKKFAGEPNARVPR